MMPRMTSNTTMKGRRVFRLDNAFNNVVAAIHPSTAWRREMLQLQDNRRQYGDAMERRSAERCLAAMQATAARYEQQKGA